MDVAFEVERFARANDGGLEVAGRWRGLDGRRVRRPRLTVVAGGRRVGIAAAEADELITDGEPWRARFYFEGDTDPAAAAELDVGRNLVVELPPPDARPAGLEPEPEPSEPAAAVQLDSARLQRAERTLEQARAELTAAEAARMQAQAEAEHLREVAELRTAEAQTTRAENEEQRAQLQRLVEQAGRYEQALAQQREGAEQALAQERERAEQALAQERERARGLEAERARLEPEVARLEAERARLEGELERERAQAEATREDLAAARRRPDPQASTRVDPPPARPRPPREPVTRPLPAAAGAEGRRPLWTGAAEPRPSADPTQRLDPETWWASHQPPRQQPAWSVWLARVLALGMLLAVVVGFALVTGAL